MRCTNTNIVEVDAQRRLAAPAPPLATCRNFRGALSTRRFVTVDHGMRGQPFGVALLVAAVVAGCLLGAGAASPQGGDERVPVAAASYETPIVYAETNRGLKPSRLQAYGRTHYYQVGGLCSRGGALPVQTWTSVFRSPRATC